ncbi:kinase-like protein [Schizopora paradoxa]|uniref:Kinase-like protein n=1 Tax=Schizopora paradoxa TaxID=27342 RepID=A0A0H2RUV6_9AGAM|nr:kinase-like protein [Schizopora paradoxa]
MSLRRQKRKYEPFFLTEPRGRRKYRSSRKLEDLFDDDEDEDNGGERPSKLPKHTGMADKQIYWSLIELRNSLQFHKKSCDFMLSVCEAYVMRSIASNMDVGRNPEGSTSSQLRERASEWMRSLKAHFEKWALSSWIESIVEHKTRAGEAITLITSLPSDMLDIWRKSNLDLAVNNMDGNPKDAIVELLQNDIEELIGDPTLFVKEDHAQELLNLKDDKAQNAIDLLDMISVKVNPEDPFHRKCEKTLRRLCARTGLLPRSITLSESDLRRTSNVPTCGGGFADIFEGEYRDKAVALKVLRVYGRDNVRKVMKSFCKEAVFWRCLKHSNVVPFLGVICSEMLSLCMVSAWMKNGNMARFLKANPHANRLELLVDVAKGLHYLHGLRFVHGDIKSANVLIDDEQHACLSDFGLAAVTHDTRTVGLITESTSTYGSTRWMAPELLDPTQSGREAGKTTSESDIYAFGMLMLEAFTGDIPYGHHRRDATVVIDVIRGIRPVLPGTEATSLGFSDNVRSVLELSWDTDWEKRPKVQDVLESLEKSNEEYDHSALLLSMDLDAKTAELDDSNNGSGSDGAFSSREATPSLRDRGARASPVCTATIKTSTSTPLRDEVTIKIRPSASGEGHAPISQTGMVSSPTRMEGSSPPPQ